MTQEETLAVPLSSSSIPNLPSHRVRRALPDPHTQPIFVYIDSQATFSILTL